MTEPLTSPNWSRRRFLRNATLLAGAVLGGTPQGAGHAPMEQTTASDDEAIFRTKIAEAERNTLRKKSIGEAMAALGLSFLGTPYVAHTLEEEGEEHLVVNLRGLDCSTFMENSLVLARCVRLHIATFAEYRKQLTFVRYRSGTISGYPSRLHYFTDWVYDNTRKGVLRDLTADLGGGRSDCRVNFMSTHPDRYRQLSNPEFVRAIRNAEDSMNARGFFVVPARRIGGILPKLRDGDIVGTATTIPGLDVSHTGIVVRKNGIPRFLHASLSGGVVCLADGSLADYVTAHSQMTGIVVARPSEPAAGS